MKNVILIGFMGAGKTSVGKKLARRRNCRFVDTDLMIEEQTGQKISDIFAQQGEACFRDLETEALKELLTCEEPMVIAVGGGLPVRRENRELLARLGTTVYLKASVDTLLLRLSGDKSRPKLQGGDLRERIESLMAAREALYEEAADIEYLSGKKTLARAVEEIDGLVL